MTFKASPLLAHSPACRSTYVPSLVPQYGYHHPRLEVRTWAAGLPVTTPAARDLHYASTFWAAKREGGLAHRLRGWQWSVRESCPRMWTVSLANPRTAL